MANLHQLGLLQLNQPITNEDVSEKFWKAFSDALEANPKGRDGKRRILSIITEFLTYEELKNKLNVSKHEQ